MGRSSKKGVQLTTINQTAPITSLTILPASPPLLLAGTASTLLALRLGTKPTTPQRFSLLERDRIHAVVVKPADQAEPKRWTISALGGREAALAEVSLGEDDRVSITRTWFINTPDWVHAAAFISDSSLVFITAHNSILHYTLSTDPTKPPTLTHTYHCPSRPLLWTAAFSRPAYATLADVRAGAGSMIGDAFYWSLDGAAPTPEAKEKTVSDSAVVSLRGHYNDPSTDYRNFQGGVFCLAFDADGKRIATGSDDRTIRVWDLPPETGATAEGVHGGGVADGEAAGGRVIGPSRTMWGHEGRVWRLNWLAEDRLASVAEDTTCRIWSLAPDSEAAPIVKTFGEGHDGRSIWSLASYQLDDEACGVHDVCVTGGADGAVRTWAAAREAREMVVPKEGEYLALDLGAPIRSFHAAELPDEGQVGLAVTSQGCLYSTPLPPSPATPPTLLHQAAGLRAPCLLHLTADRILCFSNLGLLLSIDRATCLARSCETGVAVVEWALTDDRQKVALFERRGSRVVVLDLAGFVGGEGEQPAVVANLPLDRKCLVRSLAFSPTADTLALGTHKGAILVYSLDGSGPSAPAVVNDRAHAGMVNQLAFRPARAGGWELESVSKDGTRGVHWVGRDAKGQWAMRAVRSDALSRGEVSQILPPAVEGGEARYIALVELTALVLDAKGSTLSTFISPGRYDPTIVCSSRGIDLYRLLSGKVHRQFAPAPPAALPAATLLPRFHGREVRAVALDSFALPGSARTVDLMYTGAENAVSRLSVVSEDGQLRTLWEDPQPVAAVKAVAIARSGREGERAVLFAAGVREHIRAWKVELNADEGDEEGEVRARVLAAGAADTVTDSGGEVRVMDLLVLPLDPVAGTHLGVTCLSDGFVWAWVYDERTERCRHVAGSGWHAKCVLTLASVEVAGRLLLFSGASDGMVGVWELTGLREALRRDPGAEVEGRLGEPVLSHRAHLSGVNGLDVVRDPATSTLLLATAGDDNSLTLASLAVTNLSAPTSIPVALTLTPVGSLPNAHSSTIQGLKLLSTKHLLSNSVDQRLSVHRLATGVDEGKGELFQLVGAEEVAVADCSGMTCLRRGEEGEGRWRVAVVGIGAELIDVKVKA